MKYVKPNAEVIQIENEDIITASGCPTSPGQNSCVNPGSNMCISSGSTNAVNNYESMVSSGYCQPNATGRMGGGGVFGCSTTNPGVVCSSTPGEYSGCFMGFIGFNRETSCGSRVGANNL